MKRIITFFILLLCTLSVQWAEAQDNRYVEEIFSEVSVTPDVVYGGNGTLLYFAQTMGDITYEELKMDIYEPVGDTQDERPLVLVFHNGNFLPPVTNGQISGLRTDSSAVEVCKQLARRGFTAASVSYRLGWNPLAASQPERALGLIQAAYRGVQDGRTAIRFFNKTYQEDGNPYSIDPNKITVWGNGTGGYLVLGLTGLSDYNEIPGASNPTGKFLLDLNGDMVPETPMIVEAFHGDINGEVTTVVPMDGFGLMAGDTSNYANHVGFSNEHHLSINVGGALGDISWLDDNTTPMISVQSPFDQFAPYNDDILKVPTTGDPIVQVQGAQKIGEWLESSGTNQPWKDYGFSDATTMEAEANSATAGHDYYEGVYPLFNPVNSNGFDEGVVLNWWNPTDPTPVTSPCMGLPWNMCPHPSGGTFHDQGLALNENMSAAKSKANIAKVMNYFIPRACLALGMQCDGINASAEEALLDESIIDMMPNPASDLVIVRAANNKMIQSIELYTIDGRLISSATNVNSTQTEIQVNNQTTGMYIVKIYMEEGIVAKKLSVK